jgi:arylsulfatase A-like enzyme
MTGRHPNRYACFGPGRPLRRSDVIVNEALAFIGRAAGQKKPFLAVIWYGNPHSPHRALPEDQKAAGGSAYYGEIVGIDRTLGRPRGALRKLGIADDTPVWFCSDNGATGPGSTGGRRGKKGSVWEGGVRVPGLVEWPARIRKPCTTDAPAVTSDIYPTVLDLVGVKSANPVEPPDGVSLAPLFDGQRTERPRPIGVWHGIGSKNGSHAALTDNRYKPHKLGPAKYEL